MTSSNPPSPLGTRINIVGTSGSGKSTFGRALAARLGLPYVELDSLYWKPNWEGSTDEEFAARVSAAVQGDEWVIDGNYSRVRPMMWSRAHTVVWLDYPRWLIMRRVLWRTLRRTLTGQELWAGNRERLTNAIFAKDSIILWAWNTYPRNRAKYLALNADPANAHIRFVHLRSPKEERQWLAGIPTSPRV